MNKRAKILASVCSLVVALCAFSFGVFAATKVSYEMSNTVSYLIQDALVKITRTVEYVPLAINQEVIPPSFDESLVSTVPAAAWVKSSEATFQTYNDAGTWQEPESYSNGEISDSVNINFNLGYAYRVIIKISSPSSDGVKVNYNIPSTIKQNVFMRQGTSTIANGSIVTDEKEIVYYVGLSDATIHVGTNVDFEKITLSIKNPDQVSTAQDIYLHNALTSSGELTQFANTYSSVEQNPIDFSGITVASGQTETNTLNMSALSSSYTKVNLYYTALPTDVSVKASSCYLPQNPTNSTSQTYSREYKIYITNNSSSDIDVSTLDLNLGYEETSGNLLQHDTQNKYYYVEMGTISKSNQIEYIRWRYVSGDGQNRYNYSANSAPTGQGYFILETYVGVVTGRSNYAINACSYNNDYETTDDGWYHVENGWTNIKATDYATSTARQYINGNKVYKGHGYSGESNVTIPGGHYSDMYTDFNIDAENDKIILDALKKYKKDMAILIVSHRASTLSICDRTYTFKENSLC
mgnify:CR=1 FL=1